jgi:hypothetical protein
MAPAEVREELRESSSFAADPNSSSSICAMAAVHTHIHTHTHVQGKTFLM